MAQKTLDESYEVHDITNEPELTLILVEELVAPDAAPVEAIELPRFPIEPLRAKVADLAEQIQSREAQIAQHRVDLEQSKASQANERLGDDELEGARLEVRVRRLDKEIARLSRELPVLRYQHDRANSELTKHENRLGMARAFEQGAHTLGLAFRPDLVVKEWVRTYYRSLAIILSYTGEHIEPRPIAAPEPRYSGGGVPAERISGPMEV